MNVTIYQINGRVFRLSNVSIIMEDENIINVWQEDKTFKRFESDLIAQIKIGGKNEYKKG